MKRYDRIFELSKKIANALSKGENPIELHETKLLSEDAKKRISQELSKESVEKAITKLKKIDVVKDWEHILPRIKARKKRQVSSFYKVAAAAILLMSLAYVTFYNTKQSKDLGPAEPQIVAGTDKAVLTLEDGSLVVLQKGVPFQNELVKSNGEQLKYQNARNSSYSAFNYLTVPRGGKYQLVLSDGTKVWLNADTKLKYPTIFKEGVTRKVELLYGEAYFDVSPSTKHLNAAFKVLCKEQEVEVVGTEFNVKAYSDEDQIYTTLVEGKVDISINGNREHLTPGEQSVLDLNTNHLTKSRVNVNYDIAWVKGYFNFKNKPLRDIMKVLSRWYDVDISLKDPELQKVKFSGLLSRKQNIEDILNGIKNTKYINAYEIKNKIITIK